MKEIILLDAVTATTTSEPINLEEYTKVAFQFLAASISSGNGVFIVEVTMDGTNWITYNRLVDNVINSNVQGDVRVASKTISTNVSVIVFIPDADLFKALRVKVTRTTDGAYSAFVVASK